MAKPGTFGPEVQKLFLEALRRTGELGAAAAVVNVSAHSVYLRRRKNPEFDAACLTAVGQLYDELMGVARKLAIDGVVDKFYKDGKLIREKKAHSERMLIRWIERTDPARWALKSTATVEHTGTVEHKHEHEHAIKPADMTAEQRCAARAFLRTIPDPAVESN